jgi:hypothetical protein
MMFHFKFLFYNKQVGAKEILRCQFSISRIGENLSFKTTIVILRGWPDLGRH